MESDFDDATYDAVVFRCPAASVSSWLAGYREISSRRGNEK
jgi:hypothetical protein